LLFNNTMISTNFTRPSVPRTLGELRRMTEHLPDDTPLAIEGLSDFPAPGAYVEEDGTLVFVEVD